MRVQIAEEAQRLVHLAWPIFLAQVAQTSMGFVDTIVSGRAGALDMAAVALGSAFWLPVILFGQGVLAVVTPVVARQRGRHGHVAGVESVGHEIRQGLWLALLLSAPLAGVILGFCALLPRLDYEPALADMSQRYLRACVWGLPGYLLFAALRCGLDGLGRVRAAMVTAVAGLGLNILGDVAFVLGKWGFPAYGGVGAGIATAIVCWCMAGILAILALRMPDVRSWLRFLYSRPPHPATLRYLCAVGLPTAAAQLCEVSLFAAIAVLIAPLGHLALAANQIAMSVSGMVFMLPLSISLAVTIRIGAHIGAVSHEGARLSARAGMALGLVCAAAIAVGAIALRHRIPHLFAEDPLVAGSASALLVLMACYQFPDALQVIAAGSLRAYRDTRAIFRICFPAYWCLGLPLGFLLGRTDWVVPARGARGFWIAIIAGLTVTAVCMLIRLRRRERLFGQRHPA
jgi:MATE family multidrug resistance protein